MFQESSPQGDYLQIQPPERRGQRPAVGAGGLLARRLASVPTVAALFTSARGEEGHRARHQHVSEVCFLTCRFSASHSNKG